MNYFMATLFLAITTLCILSITVFLFYKVFGVDVAGLFKSYNSEMLRLHNINYSKIDKIIRRNQAQILNELITEINYNNFNRAEVDLNNPQMIEAGNRVATEINSYGVYEAKVTKHIEDDDTYAKLEVKRIIPYTNDK